METFVKKAKNHDKAAFSQLMLDSEKEMYSAICKSCAVSRQPAADVSAGFCTGGLCGCFKIICTLKCCGLKR